MAAYYNEIDPYAAQWLRNLIIAGHIAPGDVDERSIEDVRPDELVGYTQCHFFAGIGIWSLALRNAGWPDNRSVWTGSCPCQPFSASGKKNGFDDERHLWPAFHWLIKQCRPRALFGEQVASKAAEPWLDLVQSDLEALDYAFGAVAFPSAGVGAPHIRDRTYWVANGGSEGLAERISDGSVQRKTGRASQRKAIKLHCDDGGMADSNRSRCESWGEGRPARGHRSATESDSGVIGLADTDGAKPEQPEGEGSGSREKKSGRPLGKFDGLGSVSGAQPAGPTNGHWGNVDWLFCRDGKWRPVEPGTFPLVDGAPARVGRLRAYGNAINAIQAAEFIQATMTER